jgi:hypothetical protein
MSNQPSTNAQLRFAASLVALALGVAAAVIAIVLLHTVLA